MEYIQPLVGTDVDTVVLGCTHYPLLQPLLQRVLRTVMGRDVDLVNSATAVAEAAVRLLQQFGLERDSGPAWAFYVTDAPDHVESVARRFWTGRVLQFARA